MSVDIEDIKMMGEAIYKEKIRHKVHPKEKGKVIVIDINSGDYEIDPRGVEASLRLVERQPDAIMWARRVGYRAVHSIGGFPLPEDEVD